MDEQEGALDLRTAKIDDLKGRDLSPGVVARAKAPVPTWFVKRLGDGYIFACEEREAWDIINNHSTWKRHDFKFIGHSDGKTYKRLCDESMAGAKKLEPEISRLKVEISKYRAAEEKMIIDEAVDMDGDVTDTFNEQNKQKVLRLRKIIDKQDTQLEALETEYNNFTRNVVKRATDAEMQVAIENWKTTRTWPGAVNIYTPAASPAERARILKSMPQA